MLDYDFDQSVGYWLTMATQSIRRVLSQRLAAQNLTLRQWEVLVWLARSPDMSQSQLADCMGIEPPTLAGVVNRMERDGWLVKTNCDEDRRRCRLHPTPKSEEIWKGSISVAHAVRAQAVVGISPDDILALKRICETIRENLEHEVIPTAEVESPDNAPATPLDQDALLREMKTIHSM